MKLNLNEHKINMNICYEQHPGWVGLQHVDDSTPPCMRAVSSYAKELALSRTFGSHAGMRLANGETAFENGAATWRPKSRLGVATAQRDSRRGWTASADEALAARMR